MQNGDVDGALREYEKLVETPESDPYNFVLLADLLFKKGDHARAAERYLNAVGAYEKAGLYKNAIAVCKKMSRLSLSQTQVLRHLADLHALDGLVSEASVYYAQFAEHMLRTSSTGEAVAALRKAFDNGQENVKLLEQMADALLMEGETGKAAEALREAAEHWRKRHHENDARRCLDRANLVDPGRARVPQAPGAADSAGPSQSPARSPSQAALPRPAPGGAAPGKGVQAVPGEVELDLGGGPETPALPMPSPPAATPRAPEAPATLPQAAAGPRSASIARPTGPAAARPAPPVLAVGSTPEPDDVAGSEDGASPPAGVYEIGAHASTSYERALSEAQTSPPTTTDPYAQRANADVPTPSMIARRPPSIPSGAILVESLLQRAQEEFRAGRRDTASQALVDAALAYEGLGRLDSAATIFRSLGRGAQSASSVMELWLANCEKRGDRSEGSQVACELGDRSLNDGQAARALAWFEHAAALDPGNDTARRRMQRLSPGGHAAGGPHGAPHAAGTGHASPPLEGGRVEVAVGRGQAVTFDLEALLQEFQRGVDAQLEGDAQGHYDLGMAYREMGLHEQAVQSFQIALRDSRFAGPAHEMLGRSFADIGQHDAAVRAFGEGLRTRGLDATAEAELRYLRALSLAGLGDMAGAVADLEIADMRAPGRAEVVKHLVEWRRAFGQAA